MSEHAFAPLTIAERAATHQNKLQDTSGEEKRAKALTLFDAAGAISGPGRTYIHETRKIPELPVPLPAVRFQAALPENLVGGPTHPALIFLKTGARGERTGIQAVFLTPAGEKAKISVPKRSLGSGGLLVLSTHGEKLLVCEGPEDALTLQAAEPQASVIATIGVSGFKHVPDFIQEHHTSVIVVSDRGPGEEAARHCAEHMASKGLSVSLALPPKGCKDVNDALRAHGLETVQAMIACPGTIVAGTADKRLFLLSTDDFNMHATKGLHFVGGKEPIWVCSTFEVIATARDETSTNWSTHLRWHDPAGNQQSWEVRWSILHKDGPTVLAELASRGLTISPTPKARTYLLTYLATARPSRQVLSATKTGWHEHNGQLIFVLPSGAIGDAAGDVVFKSTSPRKSPYSQEGTLDEWKDEVARPCEHNSRQAFAISAGFAGSLSFLVGAEGGGFHFYGRSGDGKTTTLRVGASPWGRGEKGGAFETWRSTDNGLEGIATLYSDIILPLDEIGQATSQTVADASYMLAHGTGKNRAGRDGELRKAASWRTLILSSGELSLEAKIAEDRTRKPAAGQLVRIVDIPSDAGKGLGAFDHIPVEFRCAKELADHLGTATKRYYGSAGPALISRVIKDPEGTRSKVQKLTAEWVEKFCPNDADSQVQRAADRFALVAAAGEFAISIGVLPWSEGSASRSAERVFKDWIEARGGIKQVEEQAGLGAVRKFLAAHGTSRFEPVHGDDENQDPAGVRIHQRAGFIRHSADNGAEWLIFPDIWKAEVVAGHDPGQVAQVLAERGILKTGELAPNGQRKLQRKERLPGSLRPTRFYVVTSRIWGDESPEPAASKAATQEKPQNERRAFNPFPEGRHPQTPSPPYCNPFRQHERG